MKRMDLISLFGLVALMSCTRDLPHGSTIDQIEIIHREQTQGEVVISDEKALVTAEITELMKTKAADFAAAIQTADKTLDNNVYVYAATLSKYTDNPEKLAARISLLGYTGVYLSPGGSRLQNVDPWLRRFIAYCSDRAIKVYATYYEDFEVFTSEAKASECISKVTGYNKAVKPGERFAGMAADLEPHIIKSDIGLGYVWNSDTGYGVGKQNDKLLEVTLDRLSFAHGRLHLSGLQLQEAIWWNYQIKNNEGKLSKGTIPQFESVCDWVCLMSYRNSTDGIWEISEPSLKAATKEKTVSICVKTATNDEAVTTIWYNGWNAMISTMTTLKSRGLEYSGFRGLDMFTYDALEQMWEWTDDKNQRQ